jgi:hypothetical protein
MLDGYSKLDPPTQKMLPVELDVPKLLVEMGYGKSGTTHLKAIGDLALIAFYCLLQIGEYIIKGKQNNTKQQSSSNSRTSSSLRKIKRGSLCASQPMPHKV